MYMYMYMPTATTGGHNYQTYHSYRTLCFQFDKQLATDSGCPKIEDSI